MKIANPFLAALLVFLYTNQLSAQQKTYIIPVLHGLHKSNHAYNYDSLKSIISRIKPDIIAVEIRMEDIGSDTSYLKKNYPYEMWMMGQWFPAAKICGFDWLGEEIQGKTIPDNYWKEQAAIKQWERKLNTDSIYIAKLAACDSLSNARMRILKKSTLREILSSPDANLIKEYYSCLETTFAESDYEKITDFYYRRNKEMLGNLQQIRRQANDKVLVIITGDDHYPYLSEGLNPDKLIQ